MHLRARVAFALWFVALCTNALPAGAFELPNIRYTPGAVGFADGAVVTAAAVCRRGYAARARHPYDSVWRRYRAALFREYGIARARWSLYTVDHLVPIELGGRPFGVRNGAYDLRNVWPQPKAEAKRKDAVEDALRAAVCSPYGYRGLHLSIERAERAIAHDWMHTPVALPTAKRRGTIVPIRRNVHGVPLAVFWTDTTSPGIANVHGDAASESVPYRRR